MKTTPQANYPIKPFPETVQHEEADAAPYEGIYGLRLNYTVNVCLCPAYNTVTYGLPPEPALLDQMISIDQGIVTTDAARAFTITTGPLVLLEYEKYAGQILRREYTVAELSGPGEQLPGVNYSLKYIVSFYCLTHAEYVQYAAELDAIMDREFDGANPEEHPMRYNRLDNLRHYGVVSRIHELLTAHPEILSAYEREMLVL